MYPPEVRERVTATIEALARLGYNPMEAFEFAMSQLEKSVSDNKPGICERAGIGQWVPDSPTGQFFGTSRPDIDFDARVLTGIGLPVRITKKFTRRERLSNWWYELRCKVARVVLRVRAE
jgi:hypothetical protein